MASLAANVASSRRGVRNVLKSWLRRPRDDPSPAAGDTGRTRYGHASIEAQIRLLADTAFSAGDGAGNGGDFRLPSTRVFRFATIYFRSKHPHFETLERDEHSSRDELK